MYADEESFTFMTPEGHMFASFITFSAFEGPDGGNRRRRRRCCCEPTTRCSSSAIVGGHRKEDQFWVYTLTALAEHFK